ncbi:hypothetical protein BP00DRAFT_255650 [Aspergillus indologenus CBS 114.80]|uniref:Uncharacterized protein n=1 Tax=Aspergillus indologenus CBS 114.80 TaxID=1450541 RepID=A0A2V5HW83_9EURO|nr:hypothetical protein BP00DRAFT_255650 [Aspergillus indologenus CBS 114.80]
MDRYWTGLRSNCSMRSGERPLTTLGTEYSTYINVSVRRKVPGRFGQLCVSRLLFFLFRMARMGKIIRHGLFFWTGICLLRGAWLLTYNLGDSGFVCLRCILNHRGLSESDSLVSFSWLLVLTYPLRISMGRPIRHLE